MVVAIASWKKQSFINFAVSGDSKIVSNKLFSSDGGVSSRCLSNLVK